MTCTQHNKVPSCIDRISLLQVMDGTLSGTLSGWYMATSMLRFQPNSWLVCLQVENRAALYNFASIATAADGLILSRGNLGLDVAPEKMALVQKSVVSRCNLLGKPVIITRVVDTMATAPRPTRLQSFPNQWLDLANEGQRRLLGHI